MKITAEQKDITEDAGTMQMSKGDYSGIEVYGYPDGRVALMLPDGLQGEPSQQNYYRRTFVMNSQEAAHLATLIAQAAASKSPL
jgi:hypothetical protein